MLTSRGSCGNRRLGLASSVGSPVRAVTLGSVCGAQRTASELVVSVALAKSYPPAPGEFIHGGLDPERPDGRLVRASCDAAGSPSYGKDLPRRKPGASSDRRSSYTPGARQSALAHRRHLHWQVADCSARRRSYGAEGSGTVRPRPATHVAVAARNRISASVARLRVAGADNRFPSSIGLARGGESQARRARSGSFAGSMWRTIRATSRQSAPSVSASSNRK